MSPSEVLNAAADLLEAEGWLQNIWGDPDRGPRCAMGALMDVTPAEEWPQQRDAEQTLRTLIGARVTEWNDQPGQTAENVIATLREAAAVGSGSPSDGPK